MKIFELGILFVLKENHLFAVICLKINISSAFTLPTETLLETNRETRKNPNLFSTGYTWGFS